MGGWDRWGRRGGRGGWAGGGCLDAVEELVEGRGGELGDFEQDASGGAEADVAARDGVGACRQFDSAIVCDRIRVAEVK
jgi:hypothetical protein